MAEGGADRAGTGTVAVVGLGKIGLPLAARYAQAGWNVVGVDVREDVVAGLNAGRSHIEEEPGVAELIASAHAAGRLSASSSHAAAAAQADVVIMIVPLVLRADHGPDHDSIDSATEAVAEGLRPGTLVIYETTLPVGDTRRRFGPMLERGSGLALGAGDDGLYLAFSPERVFSGRILADLDTYPKLVGGVDPESTKRAADFYRSVLAAETWELPDSETAELAKLAETTYRDVNIAFANELAAFADGWGLDILDVIRAANSQPYSHIHNPGIGVGGHCIPVYPHFLLAGAPDLDITRIAREINDGQVERALRAVEAVIGDLQGASVLVLGVTYREGVDELAYSRGVALIDTLRSRGAQVSAADALLGQARIRDLGVAPYDWGSRHHARVIITQTADERWRAIDSAWFPDLEVVYDGRNSLRDLELGKGVSYIGVGSRAARGKLAGP